MDLSKLSQSDRIIAGCGIVLFLDLLIFPWHNVDLGPFGSVSRSATESPNGFWGLLGLLLTLAVVGVTLVRAFKPDVKLPDLPVPMNQAILYAAGATAGVLLLKLVMETEYLGFGAYLGILLAGGMAFGAFQKSRES